MHPLLVIQTTGADEQGPTVETELRSNLRARPRAEEVGVDSVRDDVAEGALEKRAPPGVLELSSRRDHPRKGPEPVPVAILQPLAQEPYQPLCFPDLDTAAAGPAAR
jgi:hypothetical protein